LWATIINSPLFLSIQVNAVCNIASWVGHDR